MAVYSHYLLSYYSIAKLMSLPVIYLYFFFFNDTATTEIYTLSLHDALPILTALDALGNTAQAFTGNVTVALGTRSEEHTSELQSRRDLVCRLLLEKKKIRFPCRLYFRPIHEIRGGARRIGTHRMRSPIVRAP